MTFDLDDFEGFNAYDESLRGRPIIGALFALAQGDCDAVEIAQAAHFGLLRKTCGACRQSELLVYRAPFRELPFWSYCR